MQINKEQLNDQNLKNSKNQNSHTLIYGICKKLHNICTLTYQIKYPNIQVKTIKKNRLDIKEKKNKKTKTSKTDFYTNQCFCQTCQDIKLLEYLSQLNVVENLQHQLEKVKELIYLFD
ncbi:unnamed protein product [Paramecium primaurelia]|uniref:Uncharacterized protein n=1 Tax=Paramecium primaurelia TaxID=5886 RepID=A0A8S1MA92_PARPR|nr:unnamed protein product [Paramecium primaurelia]